MVATDGLSPRPSSFSLQERRRTGPIPPLSDKGLSVLVCYPSPAWHGRGSRRRRLSASCVKPKCGLRKGRARARSAAVSASTKRSSARRDESAHEITGPPPEPLLLWCNLICLDRAGRSTRRYTVTFAILAALIVPLHFRRDTLALARRSGFVLLR